MPKKQSLTEIRKRLDKNVLAFGWSVQAVLPGGTPSEPSFAYTIGLAETFGHPEIMMIGFEPQLMMQLLNGIGEAIRSGTPVGDWDSSDKVVTGYPVWFRQVSDEVARSWARGASERCRANGSPFSLLQMFLPDPNGLFPWESGCSAVYLKNQGQLLDSMTSRDIRNTN